MKTQSSTHLRPCIAVALAGLVMVLSGPATAQPSPAESTRNNATVKTRTDKGGVKTPGAPGTQSPAILTNGNRRFAPHGGWATRNRYVYLTGAGFGRDGFYSWRYGQPYTYPWISYYPRTVVNVFPSPPYGGYTWGFVGGQPVYQFYPYPAYDVMWSGNQVQYRLNAYGQVQLQNLAAMQQLAEQAWTQGYQQALDEMQRVQTQGTLVLRIEPAHAVLYLDGNRIGTAEEFARSGASIRLPAGRYHLEAWADGYAPLAEDLTLEQRQELNVTRKLEKTPAPAPTPPAPKAEARPTGRLALTVSPPDARVLIDGRFVCLADMAAQNTFLSAIPAGPHRLEVSRQGFRTVDEEVVISPLRPLVRRVALEKQ